MNKKVKNIIKLAPIIIIVIVGIIILLGQKTYKKQICQNIEVQILNPNLKFITENDVKNYLKKHLKDEIIGVKMSKINFTKIENTLEQNPFIKKAQVSYANSNSILIKITQLQPIVKIYSKGGNFYIDYQGYIFPEKKGYSPYTLIANGNVKSIDQKSIYQKINVKQLDKKVYSSIFSIYYTAIYINYDNFWKNFFTQIYVKNDKTIILIPRIGDFIIILGDASNLKEKFRNLRAFLKNINKIGWNKYSAINLSFKNQIVATKK